MILLGVAVILDADVEDDVVVVIDELLLLLLVLIVSVIEFNVVESLLCLCLVLLLFVTFGILHDCNDVNDGLVVVIVVVVTELFIDVVKFLRPLLGLLLQVFIVIKLSDVNNVAVVRSLTGALDGLNKLPVVSFVCAANISGAINAISGNDVGVDIISLFVLVVVAVTVTNAPFVSFDDTSGILKLRNLRIDDLNHGKAPLSL